MGDLLELLFGRGVMGILVCGRESAETMRPVARHRLNLPGWYFRAITL